MHGHGHFWGGPRAFWAMAGRGGREGGFGPFGHGFRGGGRGGGRDFLRAGRMLGDGELRLIALTLIEEQPRHGYDIIRALEERTSGFYSPSPGVVYPTLTYLEEAGYATSATEGSKKVFSITEAGKAHLVENRAAVAHVLDHLERFGRKMARAREWFDWRDEEDRPDRRDDESPESWRRLKTLRRRLRATLAEALGAEADKRARAIDILEQATEALEELFRR
jgi:DNA-binding PadR family transcriptional regulator